MPTQGRPIAIIHDDVDTSNLLVRILAEFGRPVLGAHTCDVTPTLKGEAFDVVIADIAAHELVERIHRLDPAPKVILVSRDASVNDVRRAFRGGAFDILFEPIDPDQLKNVVAEAEQAARRGDSRRHTDVWPRNSRPEDRDPLTGLLSHRSFVDALTQHRGLCHQGEASLSLVMMDLNRFREVNETYTHAVGDQVLAGVGELLQGVFRDSDFVARYGWDRFAVALPDTDEGQACRIAQRVLDRLTAQPLQLDGGTVSVRAGIGVAESRPGLIESPRGLIERAEHALAAAKQAGGCRVSCFSGLGPDHLSRRRLDQASVHTVSRWVGTVRQQLRQAYLESTAALIAAVEAKDPYTRQHSLRVSQHSVQLGRRLGLSAAQLESLRTAAALHDVGKIGVPDAVLQKPGRLAPQEFALIRRHPETALQIVGRATFLNAELPIILHHHERYDGQGYPAGLAGEKIPFGARILAVADSLDAMSSRRSYKPRYDLDRIRQELKTCAGNQWDPVVVDAALHWLDDDPRALHGDDG